MKILIFDITLSGHHLEYLHHYYRGALERINEDFVFCVPNDDFLKQKEKYVWQDADNISFFFLSNEVVNAVYNKKGYKRNIAEAKLIANTAKELNADSVILTNFIHTIPYLLWLMPKGIKVRGIIYRIYLYEQKNIRYRLEDLCFKLMARSRVMEKVFILNDKESSDMLNGLHKTKKFTFLPDPVPEVDMCSLENIRGKFNIPMSNKVFLHFGGLTKRKGTLEILKAINLCDNEQLKDKTFVFAGRIYQDMSEAFYRLIAIVEQKVQILVFDEFCTYEFLYNLCYSSDVILMPYKQTNLSSGLLGYAAVFEKPVVGPSQGLIGHLIYKYNMGFQLSEVSSKAIADSFFEKYDVPSDDYSKINSVDSFVNCIFG